MMGLTNNLRIFLAIEPCDMRKSFNGLTSIADQLKPDSLKNGALFLFTNKRRDSKSAPFLGPLLRVLANSNST